MNPIHNSNPHNSFLDLGLFHRIDINLYPLFVAIFEQKVFLMQHRVYLLANQRQAMHYNG